MTRPDIVIRAALHYCMLPHSGQCADRCYKDQIHFNDSIHTRQRAFVRIPSAMPTVNLSDFGWSVSLYNNIVIPEWSD